MNPEVRKTEHLLWFGLLLTIVLLMLAALVGLLKARSGLAKSMPVLGTVADFKLTNQSGRSVSLGDLRGHVWVADIIFTRCAGPCPRMTRLMRQLQDALPKGANARLVTLTTDPKFDTPAVLAAYADKFGADTNRWVFLTGSVSEIRKLAVESLKLAVVEKGPDQRSSPDDLFIHSTIFVLVDKNARLRGVYETDGEGIDPQGVRARLEQDIRRLEREP